MATFYFNAAVDNEWQTLGNWWTDADCTVPATSLPTSADDVFALSGISSNSGGEPTVANFTMNTFYLAIAITVTGDATFYDGSFNYNIVTGNATFNDSSYNYGIVTGNATFNGSSYNDAIVTGNATFNDYAYNNSGTVTGDATFNGSSSNNNTVTGNATFNDSSYNNIISGTVTGEATFNGSSVNYGNTGEATFNDNSANAVSPVLLSLKGIVTGNATFNGSSVNYGTVTGEATFNDSSFASPSGTYSVVTIGTRTPYPIPRGINGSSILGLP